MKHSYGPGAAREALHATRTTEREALFVTVKARFAQGAYTTDIAKEFNLSRKTASQWVNCKTLPSDTRGWFKQKCLIDDYDPPLPWSPSSGVERGNKGSQRAAVSQVMRYLKEAVLGYRAYVYYN